MFSYNTSVHEGTKRTPFELVYAKNPTLPSSQTHPRHEQLRTYDYYLIRLMARLDNLQRETRENLATVKERSKKYYDRHINPTNLYAGDYVFLRKGIKTGKLNGMSTKDFTL